MTKPSPRASELDVNTKAPSGARKPRMSGTRKVVLTAAVAVCVVLLIIYISLNYAARHADKILRAKVVTELSSRFHSHVELGAFHVSAAHGIDVSGENLAIRSDLAPALPPQITIQSFTFHIAILDLFRSPIHVGTVHVAGLTVNIPPKQHRSAILHSKKRRKIKIIVDTIDCQNAQLNLLPSEPKKFPVQFIIHKLTLKSIGPGRAMQFHASLINHKPRGDILSRGHFGPWNPDQPSETPLDGVYTFTNADLSTTKGIAGMLSSTGKFTGQLDDVTVDGEADTPDFSVDVSGHKVNLHTDFHAVVNGTNGNTYLQPVHATFLHTSVLATGYVVRAATGKGHNIFLDVSVDKGRIEDLLTIGVKTDPPVMRGNARLKAKLDLPAGSETVSHRIRLRGQFFVGNAIFTNRAVQQRVDELSLRGQGKAGQASRLRDNPNPPPIQSTLQAHFNLANRVLKIPALTYDVPGANITLAGTYGLDGRQFDFQGHARLKAPLSEVVGGWRGKLLTPVSPLFSKNGVGTEIPIKITGTKSDLHFGLKL